MHIEIHKPELEALIQQQMENGVFQTIEDVLFHALTLASTSPSPSSDGFPVAATPTGRAPGRKSLAQVFAESPFKNLDLDFPRSKDQLRSFQF